MRRLVFIGRLLFRDAHLIDLLKGAGAALCVKVIGAFALFFSSVLVSRYYGVDGAGIFFLIITIVTVSGVISRLGFDNIIIRYTASQIVSGKWGQIASMYWKLFILFSVSSILVSAFLWYTSPILTEKLGEGRDFENIFNLMVLSVIPITFLGLHGNFLKGLKKIALSELVLSAGLPVLLLVGIFLTGKNWGLQGIVISYVASAFIVAILSYFVLYFVFHKKIKCRGSFDLKGSSSPAWSLFLATIMGLVLDKSATIFLGLWGDVSDVGIFEAANRTAMLVSFLLAAVNSIAAPKFAALYKQGDMSGLSLTVKRSVYILITLALPIVFFFIIFSKTIMSIFGPDFVVGSTALVILSIGQFVNAATGSVGYLLMMTGNEKTLRNIVAFTALLHILLCSILIPIYSYNGAALSGAISLSLSNLLLVYFVKKKLGILSLPIGLKFGFERFKK